jgi:hypothetical protein
MPEQTIGISPETIVCRLDATLASPLGNETIVMNIDDNSYHILNTTGTRLWTLLTKPIAISELCDKLVAEFAVSRDQCVQDVSVFVENVIAHGLVQVVGKTNN